MLKKLFNFGIATALALVLRLVLLVGKRRLTIARRIEIESTLGEYQEAKVRFFHAMKGG
jgi:hypothetical protein